MQGQCKDLVMSFTRIWEQGFSLQMHKHDLIVNMSDQLPPGNIRALWERGGAVLMKLLMELRSDGPDRMVLTPAVVTLTSGDPITRTQY